MKNLESVARSNVVIFDNVPFGNHRSKHEIKILSEGIKGLHESGLDIQRVSFFEEPPEAIIQIKHAYTPSAKFSWLKPFSLSKPHKKSVFFLKLQVR